MLLSVKSVKSSVTHLARVNDPTFPDHLRCHGLLSQGEGVHDSVPLGKLLEDSDRGKTLHADSAYSGEGIDEMLEEYGIKSRICEKGKRNHPLTEVQHRHHPQKSKIWALVEHVFVFMENSMNAIFMQCIGLRRVSCQIGLANMVYNMCRYSQLIRLGRIKAG